MSRSIFVVMANDSVDCVFSDEPLASAYVDRQKAYQKELLSPHGSPLIYYRYYGFELDQAGYWTSRRGPGLGNLVEAPFEKRGKRADGLDGELG